VEGLELPVKRNEASSCVSTVSRRGASGAAGACAAQWRARREHATGGYTLIEVLIVVVILGIAGAMVVPSFAQTGVLRVQGAVRMLVADITVAQSDAIAFQRGTGVIFFPDNANSRYVVADVNGTRMDPVLDRVSEQQIGGDRFGGTALSSVQFTNNMLVFDEMGGPVLSPGVDTIAPTGWVDISGMGETFRISVEAYTGRVSVRTIDAAEEEEDEEAQLLEPVQSGGG
jgi:prepilin-type N-terminal cleavage/methylation domain-containing protein